MEPSERALMSEQDIRSIALMPIFVGEYWWGLIGFDRCWQHYHWSDAELDALETAANLLGAAIQRQQVETALRESETKFSQLVNNIPEVFWLRNRSDGRFLYLSPAFERVWGSSIEKAYENPAVLLEVAHPDDRDLVSALLTAEHDQPTSFEYRVLIGDEVRWVWTRTFPIVDDDGAVRQIAGIARDITERKRAELQSFELAVEQERVRILSSFILEVSHEFRTPLAVINTSIYLLSRMTDPEKQSEYIEKIGDQVRSINALVDGMLTITRLDGAGGVQMQPVLINEMLIGLREKLDERLELKRITLTEDYTPNLPTVSGDRDELALMLLHVLDNAVRYTPEGGSVTIASRAVNGHVVIEVADTGVGIKPAALPLIFDVFFREDSAHTTTGLGLGLSIVKRVAERHHGTVEVESKVGQGSVFRIRLPGARPAPPIF
jgi:PAS domain S-box-containing protein